MKIIGFKERKKEKYLILDDYSLKPTNEKMVMKIWHFWSISENSQKIINGELGFNFYLFNKSDDIEIFSGKLIQLT